MGREQAGIAIAIVSAKPAEHFRSTPAGHFYGMVAKAKAAELNLGRTIWGLRQAATPAVMTNRPAKWVFGRYSPANLCDRNDQNGGNRRETSAVERPPTASNPSRAALIKRLKRRRDAAKTDCSVMPVLLDYLFAAAYGCRRRCGEMSKPQASVAFCSRGAAMRIIRSWWCPTTAKPHRSANRACLSVIAMN
jgi:hypothetical protein